MSAEYIKNDNDTITVIGNDSFAILDQLPIDKTLAE